MSDPRATVVSGVERLTADHGRLFAVVGVFDGIHRGHLYLLRHLRREARRVGARPAVITFDHHPDEIITGQAPPLLCDPEERLARLAAAGAEVVVVQHFDAALRQTTYDVFVERLRERTELAGFLMTPDAAFGYLRLGTPTALAGLGRRDGFEVVVVPPFTLDGQPVRSTEIRAAIAAGDLAAARRMLGRSVAVTGFPEPTGDGRVRFRFPLPVALPPDGSYRATYGRSMRSDRSERSEWSERWHGTILVDGGSIETDELPHPADAGAPIRVTFGSRRTARRRSTPGSA